MARANAKIDNNFKPGAFGVSSADGETPIPFEVNPVTRRALVDIGGGSGTVIGDVRITDSTNVANVLKSDGTSAGQNAVFVAGTGMTTTTLTLNVGNQGTAWFDMLSYPWVSLEILSNSAAVSMNFMTSGDASQTNARTMPLADSQTGTPVTSTTSANGTFSGPRQGRYFRVNSAIGGANTITLVITFYTQAAMSNVLLAAQQGTWAVGANSATGSAIPANAFSIGVSDGTNLVAARSNIGTDGYAASVALSTMLGAFNGSNFDRFRNNLTGALVAAGTTTTQSNQTLTTYNAKKLMLLVNITAGAGNVTVAINGTSSSGYSTNLLTSTALAGTGTTALRIFPGATPAANLVANDLIPRNLSITATVSGSITYGIDWILAV